jgi:pyridoxal phosphate enzyme (YggS family)
MSIKDKVQALMRDVPSDVLLLAAVKGRTVEEVKEAVECGIKAIGENYLQEAEERFPLIGKSVEWHFIGHIQKRKVKKIVEIFDVIETIDSFEIASEVDEQCRKIGKKMPILIEINSGRETQKSGVMPENAEHLISEMSILQNIKVEGLMTMGPFFNNPEEIRPYFRLTKELFKKIQKGKLQNVEMKYLSMGMSDSYMVAIDEGSNIVRIGTLIFGPRKK